MLGFQIPCPDFAAERVQADDEGKCRMGLTCCFSFRFDTFCIFSSHFHHDGWTHSAWWLVSLTDLQKSKPVIIFHGEKK
jgi:hypothetical protein